MAQPVGSMIETANSVRSPLQEVLTAHPAVLIGLIAHIVGTPLQDDIVRTTDRAILPIWRSAKCAGVAEPYPKAGW